MVCGFAPLSANQALANALPATASGRRVFCCRAYIRLTFKPEPSTRHTSTKSFLSLKWSCPSNVSVTTVYDTIFYVLVGAQSRVMFSNCLSTSNRPDQRPPTTQTFKTARKKIIPLHRLHYYFDVHERLTTLGERKLCRNVTTQSNPSGVPVVSRWCPTSWCRISGEGKGMRGGRGGCRDVV